MSVHRARAVKVSLIVLAALLLWLTIVPLTPITQLPRWDIANCGGNSQQLVTWKDSWWDSARVEVVPPLEVLRFYWVVGSSLAGYSCDLIRRDRRACVNCGHSLVVSTCSWVCTSVYSRPYPKTTVTRTELAFMFWSCPLGCMYFRGPYRQQCSTVQSITTSQN